MTSEVVKNQLLIAMNQLNEKNYDIAVDIIQNIKTTINDKDIYDKADQHDKKVQEEYMKRLHDETKLHGDPWERYNKAMGFLGKLELWKARETLRFYYNLVKEHDI